MSFGTPQPRELAARDSDGFAQVQHLCLPRRRTTPRNHRSRLGGEGLSGAEGCAEEDCADFRDSSVAPWVCSIPTINHSLFVA